MRLLARDLGLGVLALVIHFGVDATESWVHVTRALGRIKADPDASRGLEDAVASYVVGAFATYVVAGLGAGLFLRAWTHLVQPRRPALFGAWTLLIGIVLANARQAILQPGVHDWFLLREWWATNVHPDAVAAVMVLCVAAFALPALRRAPARALPLVGLTLALAALWRVPTPAPAVASPGPNVVLLGVDALRPDHIHHLGYERDITPNIDAFLRESTVWTDAYTVMGRTAPSWMTILSGTLPITHGVRDPLPDPTRLVPKVPLLPQVLREKGWFTSFATDDSRFSYMVPEHGFDAILQPPTTLTNFAISGAEPRFRVLYGLLDNPLGWLFVPSVRMNQAFGRSYRPERYNAAVYDALGTATRHERFFFAAHDCTLHAPADRIWPYTLLFDQASVHARNRFRYLTGGSSAVSDVQSTATERNAAQQNLNLYDAGVVMVDAHFGELRRRLAPVWDTSIVVLLSDHGEDFFEEDQRYRYIGPNHGFHPFGQGQHHVLLAIHFPDGRTGEQTHLASLADLAPTLADALDIPWKDTRDEGGGRSLFDASPRTLYIETGLTEPQYWTRDLLGHLPYPFPSSSYSYTVDPTSGRVHAKPEFRDAVIAAKDRFVMDERYKLVWFPTETGPRIELFDWRADPLNDHDVEAEHPDVVRRLWAELLPYLRRDGVDATGTPVSVAE